MSLTELFSGIISSTPDFLKLSPYEARRDSISLLKSGNIEAFNAAQKLDRAENPDFKLNLSSVGILPDAQIAWAMLLTQVYGAKGVTKANLSYASYPPAWDRLQGLARARGVTLKDEYLEALHAENQKPSPVDLSWQNIEGGDFATTDLRGADFTWTIAPRADFRGADLRGCKFAFADLRDADFTGANIKGVDFSGADLSGARGLAVDMLAGATLDDRTIVPDGEDKSILRRIDGMDREAAIAELLRISGRKPDPEPSPTI